MLHRVNVILRLIFICTVLIVTITGCASRRAVVIGHERERVIIESEEEPQSPGYSYKIPKGHMPPPGKCRIWYPELPPGQQPPPGNCEDLRYHVPPGARLIRG
jgi:hypothetical protein